MKNKIKAVVIEVMPELIEISCFIHDNPEMGYKEFKASSRLEKSLEEHGFEVEKGIYGIETAFRGTYKSNKDGPRIAFMCEYDALPEVGHGCGHNLISTMGLGAGIALKSIIDEIGGAVVVFGTPAEETSGSKVEMVKKGAFDDITVAMMVHPAPITEESGNSLALSELQFEFTGKASHAAKSPELGINALDAAVLFFNGMNALRQHVTSDVKMHGIIEEGGQAPNIIPDKSVIKMYVRAAKKDLRDEVARKVMNIGEGAALMTGATVKISRLGESYDDIRTNSRLSDTFNKNLTSLGEKEINKNSTSLGSLDMGNVSYVVPTIHPWLGFGEPTLALHTKEFADCAVSKKSEDVIFKGACAMAMTAYDVITSKELMCGIKKEFLNK
jgi:amidohydrolase